MDAFYYLTFSCADPLLSGRVLPIQAVSKQQAMQYAAATYGPDVTTLYTAKEWARESRKRLKWLKVLPSVKAGSETEGEDTK